MILKVADIRFLFFLLQFNAGSNQVRPWVIAKRWAEQVAEEFFQQVNPLCQHPNR